MTGINRVFWSIPVTTFLNEIKHLAKKLTGMPGFFIFFSYLFKKKKKKYRE